MTITSPHNEKLKAIRKLTQRKRWREESGRFVAEGEDLLTAADAAGWTAVERYAAARQNGLSYSQFMHGLQTAGVELDRKILADMAVHDADTFRRFADRAREALAAG